MEKIWLKSYPAGRARRDRPSAYSSLNEMVAESLAKYADRVAFVQMGREVTYRQLDALTRDFAAWLQNEAGPAEGRSRRPDDAERSAVSGRHLRRAARAGWWW